MATRLTDIAAVWYQVRAWIGGFVFARKGKKGTPTGMLRSEFEAKQAKDPKWRSTGELKGMISIHPAIVKALTESGWSWMVDYRHDDEKDFMHFEDRAGERSLRSREPIARGEAGLVGDDHGLHPVAHAELGEHVRHVGLRRRLAARRARGDLGVRRGRGRAGRGRPSPAR